MKNGSNRNYSKKLIICASFIIVMIVLLGTKLNPIRLLGSLYHSNEIKDSIGKIKVGDVIDYEINGYSNWQVVSVDRENNTLDVVSRENVEDITLETKEDYENALDIFQATADKYTDDNLAIKARCVNRADLDNFAFDEEFWNADIYNGSVAFSDGKIGYNGSDLEDKKVYFLPYIRYMVDSDYSNYYIGDQFDLNIAGIDKWILAEQAYSYYNNILLIPVTPIEINIDDPDFAKDPNGYIQEILNEIKNSDSNVLFAENYIRDYGYDLIVNYDSIRSVYSNLSKKINFISGSLGSGSGSNYLEVGMDILSLDFENNEYTSSWNIYKKELPFTKGFRPIVTLKYSDELVDGKGLNNELQIGDNVNYSALEYQNWKVLSIDEENNTVDIISGGVVKNIMLYGDEDYDSFEDILQNEVDKYKAGDNVIGARIVKYSDIANLNKMNDKVNVKYWTMDKKEYNKKSVDDTSSPYDTNGYYQTSVMYYNDDTGSVERSWVSLYISSGSSSGSSSSFSGYNGVGDLSFTAGLRPIITLKLDTVEKIDENTKIDIIDSTKVADEKLNDEQKNNLNNYSKNDINHAISNAIGNIDNSQNSVDDANLDTNGKININNYYTEFNGSYKENGKVFKYIIIAIIIINIAIFIQVILSIFIIKNIKSGKRKK